MIITEEEYSFWPACQPEEYRNHQKSITIASTWPSKGVEVGSVGRDFVVVHGVGGVWSMYGPHYQTNVQWMRQSETPLLRHPTSENQGLSSA